MCGRYYISIEESELREILKEVQSKVDAAVRTGEIFPTNIVPVIPAGGVPQAMKWGFLKFDGKGHIINARSESAAEKSMFRKPLHEGRCLIPASNYFEWMTVDGKKQKYAISSGSTPLYMAGLYRYEKGNDFPAMVILTRDAAPDIAFIHDRMPVIIPIEQQLSWLDGGLSLPDIPVPAHMQYKIAL